MTHDILEHCTRAVIRHLNGDMDLFKRYTEKAMQAHWQDKCIIKIKDVIPENVKRELYRTVS